MTLVVTPSLRFSFSSPLGGVSDLRLFLVSSQATVGTYSVVKEFGIGKMSSFVQKKVEAPAFDLQRQHGRDFTPVGHAGHLVQGNGEMGTQAKGGMSGEGHLLPSGPQDH